jgi:rare lipoprotein A
VGYQERGFASWYGPGFHGQKTANGERYDMHQLTAAHRTLPLGSVVSVHSVRTGRDVVVRINDRGPFVRDRVIDLSLSAAKAIEMLGPGTDEVTLHVVSYQERPEGMGPLRIQVASFAEKANAVALVNRLSARYRGARVVTVELREGTRYRVQIGEYAREQEAAAAAKQVDHQLNVSSFIVREDP